ncbi:MAG: Type III restriction-modification system methylation subunit (EC [uncultured Thiotrichaceae bacterium]|uniref:site-specific DNA-methyltransferase (adenine-specific) n=1 Tax=uncultured Thiotrichaceae bacterium TaxID=298394 RepID=A0A6S6U6P0_9GAMM|nr:MAG: Type III restriction-modification system methylation subunit (EC [uncultured Thiotrichaceae bacterium]
MPTLNWIGKEAVVKHHKDVPYRLLEPVEELSCGDSDSGNLIVQGDNLHALKALLPRYAGKVKCIYIDPPYNTGVDDRDESGKRSGWIYSDNVNSPEIKQWLGNTVGAEAEDLSRHDKWLCMMLPRLTLLREFLRDDGVIFISIDENEYGNLRVLLDELFGVNNRVGTIIWKNATDNNPTKIAIEHEYVFCYAKKLSKLPKEWKSPNLAAKDLLLNIGNEFINNHIDQEERQKIYTKWFRENKSELWPFQDYKFIDEGGIYTGMRSVHNPGKEGYRYDVIHPLTSKPCKQPLMGYRFPESTMNELLQDGRIIFGNDETKLIELKVYANDYRVKLPSLFELDGRIGTNQIKDIFPEDNRPFDFPKPVDLIQELISFTTSENDIVLDSFAGSGTTAHAVLKLNNADGHNRRFIITEMKSNIAENVTQKRIQRVIKGYKTKKSKGGYVEGLKSGFQYCCLSEEPLFTASGQIREDVTFAQLAEFVWFAETGSGFTGDATSPLLGIHENRAIYLLYNGILKDRSVQGGNVLTQPVYKILPEFKGAKVIYAAAIRGTTWAKREQITFKQTPYSLEV